MTEALLSVEGLVKEFPGRRSILDWLVYTPADLERRAHLVGADAAARLRARRR